MFHPYRILENSFIGHSYRHRPRFPVLPRNGGHGNDPFPDDNPNHYDRCDPPTWKDYLCFLLMLVLVSFIGKKQGRMPGFIRIQDSNVSSMGGNGIYRSEDLFLLNYAAMQREFKVFVYPGGNTRTCYYPTEKSKNKYASEHYFFRNLIESRFLTRDPDEAHLFFIPLSCRNMRGKGALPSSMEKIIKNYVKSLIFKYPYWNRTLGADHFFVSCHDIGSWATDEIKFLMKNAIRLVCSPSYDSKYIPHKDVSLPQIFELSLPPQGEDARFRSTAVSHPLMLAPERQPPRTKLGFWAGSLNSDVRKLLMIFWEDDGELDFRLTKVERAAMLELYQKEFYGSKFCICPRGTQVGGVCLVESITFGCIPVILSDYYDLPFNAILDWNKFSVIVKEDDVPNLKIILQGISEETFGKMHRSVIEVKKYFEWNSPPVPYDEFHMVMYELWLRHHIVRY